MESIVANALTAYAASTSAISNIILDESATSSTNCSSQDQTQANNAVKRNRPNTFSCKQMALKKRLIVRWKDQFHENNDKSPTSNDQITSKQPNVDAVSQAPVIKTTATRLRQGSPSLSFFNILEHQNQITEQELAIRDACKFELQLLNDAKFVREKRNRMVTHLQHMKHEVRRMIVLSNQMKNENSTVNSVVTQALSKRNEHIDDNIALPPVFGQYPNTFQKLT
jgi:hypothetical protein